MNTDVQAAFSAALLDARLAPPPSLRTWNASEVARRFDVYRNNVIVSLVEALGDTFEVVRQLVGHDFFSMMAAAFVRAHPPASPVLAGYGADFPDWLAQFGPAQALSYLPGLARLEFARVQAWQAADAEPLAAGVIAQRSADVVALPASRLRLHPSLQVVREQQDVHALWAAHQCEGEWPVFELDLPCAALVLRSPADEVLVIRVGPETAAFVAALKSDLCLGEALLAAPRAEPGAALALLLRHGAIVEWRGPENLHEAS